MAQEEERRPKSLNDLLKWTIKYHETETDTPRSTMKEMDPERRAFLENALKDLTVSELELIRKSLEVLTKSDEEASEERKLEAFDNIHSLIDNLDNARDLILIGGFDLVLQYLKSPLPSLKAKAAEIVGTSVQNDFETQKAVVARGTLSLLVEAFQDESALVRKKVVYAISALIRNDPLLVKGFMEKEGLRFLKSGLKDPNLEVQTKAVFLLFNILLTEEPLVGTFSSEPEVPKQLVANLSSSGAPLREFSLKVLDLLCAASPSPASDPSLGLGEAIREALLRLENASDEDKLRTEDERGLLLELQRKL